MDKCKDTYLDFGHLSGNPVFHLPISESRLSGEKTGYCQITFVLHLLCAAGIHIYIYICTAYIYIIHIFGHIWSYCILITNRISTNICSFPRSSHVAFGTLRALKGVLGFAKLSLLALVLWKSWSKRIFHLSDTIRNYMIESCICTLYKCNGTQISI